MSRKARVEEFIIPRAGTAVQSAATDLYNSTTDNYNLPVGGFGIFTENSSATSSIPETVNGTPTISNTSYLEFILRRDQSQDSNPLPPRELEMSGKIYPNCQLRAVGTAASLKNNSAWTIGAVKTAADAVNVLDETEYVVNVAGHGRRIDQQFNKTTPLQMGRFTTPDYFSSSIYTTTEQQRDHLLHNLAYDFNRQSPIMAVAICIDSQATTTPSAANNVITVAQAAALNVGDNIVIGFNDDGQPVRLEVDQDLIQTFTLLVASLPSGTGTEQIIPYARNTSANTSVVGRLIAGGQSAGTVDAEVDTLMFISLDERDAYYQEDPATKRRITVGLDGGFSTAVNNTNHFGPSEGSGYARELKQWYEDTQEHRIYNGTVKDWQMEQVRYGNEIVTGGIYDYFIIDYCYNRFTAMAAPSISPRRLIIPILETENYDSFAGYTGSVNPHKAYVEDALNNWVGSTAYPHTTINI